MLEIIEVSPVNEMPIAKRLERAIERAWPDIRSSPNDRVRIIVGVRALREIDLLVTVNLAEPRRLPVTRRRDGSTSPPQETMQAACFAIEVKQLDPARFVATGAEIFPVYDGKRNSRSVNVQAADAGISLRNYMSRYELEPFYVHALAWLTEVEEAELRGISASVLGREAGWIEFVDAAAQQSLSVYGPKGASYRRSIETIAETLTRTRAITPRDRSRAERLCRDILTSNLIDDLAKKVGNAQIRLVGRGGSGKTTALALLAKRLAEVQGERVLLLTFHRTLRADIEHLMDTLVLEPTGRARIRVEAATTFFCDALRALDSAVSMHDGRLVYDDIPDLLAQEAAKMPGDGTGDLAEYLREIDPQRFAWDAVLIDESQDWHDGERDFVRALFGLERLVLADGLEQLVRRQVSCDWTGGVPRTMRYHRDLGRSLRMTKNVAQFANAFASELGLEGWHVAPVDELAGGRVVIAIGGDPNAAVLANRLKTALASAGAAPVDALMCVPPQFVGKSVPRRSLVANELVAAGEDVWDASDESVRDRPPTDGRTWRIVQYDSSRGLEGWVCVCFGLDQLAATKRKYPNIAGATSDEVEQVVARWLMIAVTRAVQTLVVTIADPADPLLDALRAVDNRLPTGIVEWTTTRTWEPLAPV